MPYCFEPIGIIHSCFKEKFGIPRQGILISESKGSIELLPPFNQPSALRKIESYSHIWIVFVFHANPIKPFKSTVRPPRLGGNQRVGVFASRSGFRPNPIGLSQVELDRVYRQNGRLFLEIKRLDLLDGTPILDIKPYLPWADQPYQATAGFAGTSPHPKMKIQFSSQAENVFKSLPQDEKDHLKTLIIQILENDPRPAIDRKRLIQKKYGVRVYDWNICWEIHKSSFYVHSIIPISSVKSRWPANLKKKSSDRLDII
jgi:tRNA-Thr(GGU) m(6)t(6)A37 methyltransferase TsaA